jgi:hypothetical protein
VSTLTCEGSTHIGPQAICEKYSSLGQLRHNVLTKEVSIHTKLMFIALINVIVGADKSRARFNSYFCNRTIDYGR